MYTLEKSGEYMCVPACLNMIFRRNGFKPFSQLELAERLEMVVPEKLSSKYPFAQVSDQINEWGIQPKQSGAEIQKILDDLKIPLSFVYLMVSEIPSSSMAEFLVDNIHSNNDIIVGYSYKTVFGTGGDVGHVSLVSSIDSSTENVELIDPDKSEPVRVKLRALLDGVRKKGDGFWLFSTSGSDINTSYI